MSPTSHGEDVRFLSVPLREKVELRQLVEKDERFAQSLEKTNSDIQQLMAETDSNKVQGVLALLARMMWNTLQILWDLEESSIPKLHTKQKLEVVVDEFRCVQEQLHECRRAYLKELSTLRERLRLYEDPTLRDAIHNAVYEEDPVMYYEPLQFVEDEQIKEFVAEVVEEKLKLIMTRWNKSRIGEKPSVTPIPVAETNGPSPMELMLREENERLKNLIVELEDRLKTIEDEAEEKENAEEPVNEELANTLLDNERLEREQADMQNKLKEMEEKMRILEAELLDVKQSIGEFEASIKQQEGLSVDELDEDEVCAEVQKQVQKRASGYFVDEVRRSAEETVYGGDSEVSSNTGKPQAGDGTEEVGVSGLSTMGRVLTFVSRLKKKSKEAVAAATPHAPLARSATSIEGNEKVGQSLDMTFGVVRVMLAKSGRERQELKDTVAELQRELRELREGTSRPVESVGSEDLQKQLDLALLRNQNLKKQNAEKDTEIEELRSRNHKQSIRVKELEDELARLRVVIDELSCQMHDMQQEMKDGAGNKKRVNYPLNFKRPSGGRNVFERLYRDACERLARMEYLRQRFIKEMLKMEPLVYHMEETEQARAHEEIRLFVQQTDLDADLNFLGVPQIAKNLSASRKKHASSYVEMCSQKNATTYADLCAQLCGDTTSAQTRRAKAELDRLYPAHARPHTTANQQLRPQSAAGFDKKVKRQAHSRPQSATNIRRSLPSIGFEKI